MEEIKKNECDCGCEHDHHEHDENCDCGCDMEEGIVRLLDEEGNEVPFFVVASLEYNGKEYACLQQADVEEPELEIYELQEIEEDGELFDQLLPVDDETYEAIYQQLVEDLNAEECDDPECDCHHHDED